EYALLPLCRKRAISVMAYSPIEQGRMLRHAALKDIAGRHGATAAQIALAFLLRQPGVMVIPKATAEAHVRENAASSDVVLSPQDLAELDRAFPAPSRAQPLETL